MTARKSRDAKSRRPGSVSKGREEPQSAAAPGLVPSSAAIRELIESVVIAFILAFLFRTFEAEAFVIPTGSMAPTLMGRHKDIVCPECGCPYRISSSSEANSEGAVIVNSEGEIADPVSAGTCPMCRYSDPNLAKDPSYNGDRILVGKLEYQFSEPRRWEVIVFKFPGDGETDSRTNFIKRLIGLPGETVRIQNGDIWIHDKDSPPGEFHLERKPPPKQLSMLQPVFDNRYMPRIAELGWPDRWRAEPNAAGEKGWSCDDHVAFRTDGSAQGENWLRYEHRIPSYYQWLEFNETGKAPEVEPRLITDFMAYDTNRSQYDSRRPNGLPPYYQPPLRAVGDHWVGDLALYCTVDVLGDKGELIFELRKGGRQFQCRVDAATGRATLSISGEDMAAYRPTATTDIRGPGRHDVRFCNCDNQLLLWIDDRLVQFDSNTVYDEKLNNNQPKDDDLQPVGVASAGAAAEINNLNILRDIYYLAIQGVGDYHDDRYWVNDAGRSRTIELPKSYRKYAQFSLDQDQFFALGDNSAFSKDGRLWGQGNHFVPRELLIGKALFIYWPHSFDRIPYVNIPFPYFPNFQNMGFVR